jgi:TPR repeat protein
MNRAYAKGTLIEAMDAGSDYAAVLLVPAEIDGAIDTRTTPSGYMITDNFIIPSIGPKQAKAADARVKPYFSHVKRAAEDTTWEFRQSEALYRLSHFYLFGLCCNRNINAAHDCMERAANLGHSSAQKFLPRFHKKFLGGWEFDFT